MAKIHYLAGRVLARKLKKYNLNDINPAQGRILFALWRNDGISIQELAKETALGKSTLTSMLDRLEQAGYLTREPSAKDRRAFFIKLTGKDKAQRDEYLRVSHEMTELYYRGFTEKEIIDFENYLSRILGNLTRIENK